MDPFVAALDALFVAPGSVAAVYAPADGSMPWLARTIRDQKTDEMTVGSRPVPVDINLLLLRRSEVPAPVSGDLIRIGDFASVASDAPVFEITGAPWLDTEGLTWSCEMQPQA